MYKVGVQSVWRMKLSVIVPVYNVAPYLRRCLDSVVAAVNAIKADVDVEMICIDDGSTDESAAILDEYKITDVRFKVVRQDNNGLSAARNRGLDMATGEWVAFIDSDDWISENYFTALFDAVRRTGFDIAAVDTADCDATAYWCKRGSPPAVAWGKLYRAELWKTSRFPIGRLHEDEYTTHRIVFKAGRIAGVRARLYHYTVRNDSIMRERSERAFRDWLEACSVQAEFLKPISKRAYGVALAKKIQVEHWLGCVNKEDIAEYVRSMRWRMGNYYWAEHYRHPVLINRLTWGLLKVCGFR